jgi:hypothetical protein
MPSYAQLRWDHPEAQTYGYIQRLPCMNKQLAIAIHVRWAGDLFHKGIIDLWRLVGAHRAVFLSA